MSIDYRVKIESELPTTDLITHVHAKDVSRDGDAEDDDIVHCCVLDRGTKLYARTARPSAGQPPPRFGMHPTTSLFGYPRLEADYWADVTRMADAAASIIAATECRGYAVYVEPVHFYWDRDLVVVNQELREPDATAELFRRRGLTVVVHPLAIDVGWPLVDY